MSAPANVWDQRLREVGADGVTARRIFADLSACGSSHLSLIRQSIDDGMMPVISYKVPDPTMLASGGYDGWLSVLKAQLDALDAPVTATYHHEPHGDMEPAVFRAASLRFVDRRQHPEHRGWSHPQRMAARPSGVHLRDLTDATLLNKWEFVAVDSYHSGTVTTPARPCPPVRSRCGSTGWTPWDYPNKPLGVGEYNGFSAAAVAEAGETMLATPELWFGMAWNSTAGNHIPLAAGTASPLSSGPSRTPA